MAKRVDIPQVLKEGQFLPQEETIQIQRQLNKLFIGIPKEHSFQENRVGLTPNSVKALTAQGHRVVIEDGAGNRSNFSNHEYSEAGAEIAYSREEVFTCNVLIKVAPMHLEEIELLHPNQIIISPIHLPTMDAELLYRLKNKRVVALAMEYIRDESGSFPLVRIMSEIAGISAMLTAGELLSTNQGGRGVLLGGISGVPPSKVVILGAGVVAEYASRVAIGLGAEVRIFDNNIYKLMRLKQNLGRPVYTSTIDQQVLMEELRTADVAIGAIHSESGRTPILVSEDMVENMRYGSVIIDVSIDQGGCFATSRVTTHKNPTFVKHDVIHYCVPNIASRVSRTASNSISNILTSILLQAQHSGSIESLLYNHTGLRNGVYMYKGCLTNSHLSERFLIKFTNLELLLTSNL
jgi:alanine dehydrogenase